MIGWMMYFCGLTAFCTYEYLSGIGSPKDEHDWIMVLALGLIIPSIILLYKGV